MASSPGKQGQLSPHFNAKEFACNHCGTALVTDALLDALEKLRSNLGGKPISINSGYRCPVHNKAVGGAADSMHMYGNAVDLVDTVTVDQAKKAGFTGIGTSNGRALHVDVRDTPAQWSYT